MDIFTDASLNDKKKIAGIGMVFVWPNQQVSTKTGHAYFETDNIETAELFAIHQAIEKSSSFSPRRVRLFSDSVGVLRKLQRVFQYPDQNQIHTINNPVQRKILYDISASFQMMYGVNFSFHYIKGHQGKPIPFTNGYYNMLADQEASSGRLLGEMLFQSPRNSSQDKDESAQSSSPITYWIASPEQISFHYEDLPQKPKLISKFAGRKKVATIRHVKRMSSRMTRKRS